MSIQHLVPPALVVLGSFLPWIRVSGVPTENSFEVPLLFLFQLDPTSTGLKLSFLWAAAPALAIPARAQLRRIAVGVVIGTSVLYLVQLQRLLGQSPDAPSLVSFAGFGVLVTAAGAAAALLWKPG